MTSGARISASGSLDTLPADSLARSVEHHQEPCQSLLLGRLLRQTPPRNQQGGRLQTWRLAAARASPRPTSQEPGAGLHADHERLPQPGLVPSLSGFRPAGHCKCTAASGNKEPTGSGAT